MPIMVVMQGGIVHDFLVRIGDLIRGAEAQAINAVIGLAVTLLGWALAKLASRLALGALRAARFNDAVRGLVGPTVKLRHEPASLASWAVYWVLLAVVILLALETAGFSIASSVGARLTETLPRIIASAVVFALGGLIAVVLGGLTRRLFDTGGFGGARLRGQIVTGVLTGFAALLAAEQLGFAAQFVMLSGLVVVAAAGLALGLAFGLGCRDLARDFVVEYLRSLDEAGGKPPNG